VRRGRALLLCLVALPGCFVSVGDLGLFGRRRPLEETTVAGEGRAKILLLKVAEVITEEPQKRAFGLVEQESTVARIRSELERAEHDDRVKAVVLRIDSPGGGVTASDEVYQALLRFKQKRGLPIIASLGDVAASGGYYVACAADRIVAHPTTMTGSIGVIMMNFNLEGLLGKIGVRNETFKAGEHKDLLSPFRGATPEERRIVQSILDALHARFVTIVRESRTHIDPSRLGELTDGRVFHASQALQAGLVDQIGDLDAAIEVAKAAAKVEKARVVAYQRGDEMRENIYSAARGTPVQVNLLPLDLGTLVGSGARFMYLWAPGLGD
jgi:protease-4